MAQLRKLSACLWPSGKRGPGSEPWEADLPDEKWVACAHYPFLAIMLDTSVVVFLDQATSKD